MNEIDQELQKAVDDVAGHEPGYPTYINIGLLRDISKEQKRIRARLDVTTAAIQKVIALCEQEIPKCDPFCCSEYLAEIKELLTLPPEV